jgi:hypothetical protein
MWWAQWDHAGCVRDEGRGEDLEAGGRQAGEEGNRCLVQLPDTAFLQAVFMDIVPEDEMRALNAEFNLPGMGSIGLGDMGVTGMISILQVDVL